MVMAPPLLQPQLLPPPLSQPLFRHLALSPALQLPNLPRLSLLPLQQIIDLCTIPLRTSTGAFPQVGNVVPTTWAAHTTLTTILEPPPGLVLNPMQLQATSVLLDKIPLTLSGSDIKIECYPKIPLEPVLLLLQLHLRILSLPLLLHPVLLEPRYPLITQPMQLAPFR